MNYDPDLIGNCILSAEDNEVNKVVLEHLLDEQDLPHVTVENGELAVESWRFLKPKLILMDISMPVLNGIEAIQMIRAEESAKGEHVPIVALTAHALMGDEEKMLTAGADFYVTKPVNPTMLLDKIEQILGAPKLQVAAQNY